MNIYNGNRRFTSDPLNILGSAVSTSRALSWRNSSVSAFIIPM